MPRDVADSASVQTALLQETSAFTKEQRVLMSATVASHMSAVPMKPGGNNKMQSNLHLYNYLTDGAWSVIFSKDYTYDQKMEYIADFLLAIGCRNASDDTVKLAIAIINVGSERSMTPAEAYMHLNGMKTKLEEKRKLKPGSRTAHIFPADPADFLRLYPSVYLECEPPVATRIDDMKLRQMTRKDMMPSRSNNKMLNNQSNSTPGATSSNSVASNAVASNILEYVLGNCQNGTTAVSQLLALANGDRHGGPPSHILEPRSKRNRMGAIADLPPAARDPSMGSLSMPSAVLAIDNKAHDPSVPIAPVQSLPTQAAAPPMLLPPQNQLQVLPLPTAVVAQPPAGAQPSSSALDAVVAQAKSCLIENAKISAAKAVTTAKAKAKAAAVAAAVSAACLPSIAAAAAVTPSIVVAPTVTKPHFRVKGKTAIANLPPPPPPAVIPQKSTRGNLNPITLDEFPDEYAAKFLSAEAASVAKSKGSFTSRAYDHCRKFIDADLAKRAYQYAAHVWNSTHVHQ